MKCHDSTWLHYLAVVFFAVFEFLLGRSKKIKPNSTLELFAVVFIGVFTLVVHRKYLQVKKPSRDN